MMSRVTWILGNWKQNHARAAAAACARQVAESLETASRGAHASAGEVRVGIAPPYLSIDAARPFTRPHQPLWLFAQDVAAQDDGAFTGEVGPAMLREAGVEGSIVGHSERRSFFGDTDALVGDKLSAALSGGLTAVLCIGERLEAREAGEHESTVISQLDEAFAKVDSSLVGPSLVLAYEPVWAIGTGRVASPEQAAQMHRTIRGFLRERFAETGAGRSILYGGSVKPDNAAALVATGDVDGFLVGGASLDPTAFVAIVRAAAETERP
jgi:triosephosphate isomerase